MKVFVLILGLMLLAPSSSISQESLFTDEWHEKLESDLEFISFPNPNKGTLSVRVYRSSCEFHSVCIRNEVGRIVYESTFEREFEIDMFHLEKGMYFIEVSNEKKKSYSTIVIK